MLIHPVDDGPPRIWLIDRRGHWRGEALRALGDAGFETQGWEEYVYPPRQITSQGPNLVVVSGTTIGEAEQQLIRQVLRCHHPLVVVSGRLSGRQSLDLLRAGALDAAELPPDRAKFVSLVQESLRLNEPVSGYETVARGMASQ